MSNIHVRASVRSISTLDADKGIFQALLFVFAVNGRKLETPIMVDEKLSAQRLFAWTEAGIARGATINYNVDGINSVSHRELPAKDGYPERPLFSHTGPMTNVVAEKAIKPRECEAATNTVETPAPKQSLLERAMNAAGLTKAEKPKAKKPAKAA